MPKCPLFKSNTNPRHTEHQGINLSAKASPISTKSAAPTCQHPLLSDSASQTPNCNGEYARCVVKIDDQQLSKFIEQELHNGHGKLTLNEGDSQSVLNVEIDTWLGLELTRRFGLRQSKAIETVFTLKQQRFQFSTKNMPVSFGDIIVFTFDVL